MKHRATQKLMHRLINQKQKTRRRNIHGSCSSQRDIQHSLAVEKRFLFPVSWNLFTRCNVQIYYLWIIHQPGETFTNVITDERLSGRRDNQESGEPCLMNLQTLCQSAEINPDASVFERDLMKSSRRSTDVFVPRPIPIIIIIISSSGDW